MAVNNDGGKLSFTASIDNSQLKKDAEAAKEQLRGVGKSAEDEGSRIDAAFKKIGKSIAAVFTAQQAMSFAKEILKVRGEVESLEKSFSILAGKEYGKQLFEDIRQFTLNTPMMMKDLASGAQTLLAFNIAAEEVMPILRSLGDISMGDAQRFQSLTLAFAQMSSTGKLTSQDLMQMVNAGFNPLSVISQQTSKSIAELRDEMSKGAISAEMVKQAFMDATSEGGQFYGMLETQSKGIAGQMSNLQGAIEDMFNEMGKDSEGVITGAIEAATNLVKNYEEVGRTLAELIATYGLYKAALVTITALQSVATSLQAGWTAAELAHYNVLLLVEKAQALLNATILKNPYVLAAAAVAALAYGMYKLITHQTEAEKAQARLNETTKKYETEVISEQAKIDSLFARLKAAKEETEEYEKAKKAIINQYGEYLEGLSAEVKSLGDVEAAYKAVTKAAQEAAMERARASATQDAADAYAASVKEARDKIYKTLENQYKGQTDESGMSLVDKYYWEIVEGTHKSDTSNPLNSQYQTNTVKSLQTYAKRIEDAQKILDDTMREIDRSLGTGSGKQQTGGGEGGEEEAVKEVRKNKQYWEEYKKEQQGLLDAMDGAELQSAEAARIRGEIAEADRQLAAYNVGGGSSGSGSSGKQQQQEYQRRAAQIEQYGADVAAAMRQAEFEIRQAGIEAMEDGVEKELEQVRLNYDRLIAENERREAEWVEELRAAEKLRWQQAHGGSAEGFDGSAIGSESLTEEQIGMLKEYTRVANEYQVNENKKAIAKMLDDFLMYEQRRTQEEEKYARIREAMYTTDESGNQVLRAGVTQGNVSELDMREEKALAAIDEEFAQREATYRAWCEKIADLTIEQLERAIEEAEQAIEEAEQAINDLGQEEGGDTSQQLAVLRAQKNALQAQKDEKEASGKSDDGPGASSLQKWKDLYKVLNQCNDIFKELGDSVDGTAGKIISSLGTISTATLSMTNGIMTLVESSVKGIEGTAAAGVASLTTLEKASVILTIISAVMQVAMAIVNLFNNDDKLQDEIDKLQRRIDQLQWELDNMDAVRLEKEAGDAVEVLRKKIYEAKTEVYGYFESLGSFWERVQWCYRKASKDAELMSKTVEKLADYYGNLSYTADKALGTASWKEARSELENIMEQMVLVNEQLDAENEKKETDKDQVQEYEQTLQELAEKAETLLNDMVEDIMGGSASDLAEKLGDALIEAFEAGEDAAEKWGETVNDIVKDILKNLIVTELIEEPIGELFNKYKQQWFPNGEFTSVSKLNESINDFAAEMNELYYGVVESAEAIWDALDEQLGLTDTERNASESGIATASQESVDELNGRATAIQGHTYSINEQTKQLAANSQNILESVLNIELYASRMSERMETVEDCVSGMRTTLNDFSLHGIKIK